MVCSACGHENQVGNRFCGMCGTPLPHRPLTAPGAQGTHSFTRVPLAGGARDERQPATTTTAESRGNVPKKPGPLIEMASTETREESLQHERFGSDMVPEVSLDEYVKSFCYVPPADPDEVTMRGDVRISRPEPSAADDQPSSGSPTPVADGGGTPPTLLPEDVRERLGLEDAGDADERDDRPRFLDFNQPSAQVEEPEAPEATNETPSFLKLSDIRRVTEKPPAAETVSNLRTVLQQRTPMEDRKSSWLGRGLTWLAVAALIAFVALGVLEWRSQVNHTNQGPVEVTRARFRDIMGRYNPLPQASNPAKPPVSAEEPPKTSPSQAQNTPSSPNATSSTTVNNSPVPPESGVAVHGTNPPQDTTAAAGTTKSGEQKAASPGPGSPLTALQASTSQKPVQPKTPPPTNTAKPTSGAEIPRPPPAIAEQAKPKPQSDQGGEPMTAVNKAAPGSDELAKANNASDAAAAAAWLWKATAKGNPDAPVRLADMYVKGDGVPRSCEQALVLLKTAATKDSVRARNRLASMYSSGTCVQPNRVQAYRWLSSVLAADPNNQPAQRNRELIWQQMTPEERTAVQQ